MARIPWNRLAALVAPASPPEPQAPEDDEPELEALQRTVTLGQLADHRRHRVICELHRTGVTQVELAERLSKASVSVGGPEVGLDAVQKIWTRYRYRAW